MRLEEITEQRFCPETGQKKDPWITTWIVDGATKLAAAVPDANKSKLKLLVAAPEMLEALEEAAQVLKTQNNGNCLVSVLDAIKKAKGE